MYKTFRVLNVQPIDNEIIAAVGFLKSPNLIGWTYLLRKDGKLMLPCQAQLGEKEEKLVVSLFHKGLKKLCNQ